MCVCDCMKTDCTCSDRISSVQFRKVDLNDLDSNPRRTASVSDGVAGEKKTYEKSACNVDIAEGFLEI